MIFHPAILAILSGSLLTLSTLIYANWYGIKILRHWNVGSGSELQLKLERRTYLISTVMAYALGFQFLSLFLFVYTADNLAPLFVGAMCAAGTLNVNSWGYSALILKILNFLAAGVWLVINAVDNNGYDYPLIKKKYSLLLVLMLSIAVEATLQTAYFLNLKPDLITSCCGTLFSSATSDVPGISVPRWKPVAVGFYSLAALTMVSGLALYLKSRGAYLFSLLNGMLFVVAFLALVAYVSPHIYELPTHSCPFCILHGEYDFIGYPLYLAILVGGVSGVGVGAISPFSGINTIEIAVTRFRKRLTLACLLSWLIALGISLWRIMSSNLTMS